MTFFKPYLFLGLVLCIHTISFGQNLTVTYSASSTKNQEILNAIETKRAYASIRDINNETKAIIEQLQMLGYIDAVSGLPQNINKERYEVLIRMGEQWQTIAVTIPAALTPFVQSENKSPAKDTLMMIPVKYAAEFMEQLSYKVAQEYDPFSEIALRLLEKDTFPQLKGSIHAKLYPKRIMRHLVIIGYPEVSKAILTHQGGLKLPMNFGPDALAPLDKKLNQIPYFNITKPTETLFEEEATTLYLYLEKKNNNSFDGLLGFATDPETQQLSFNGYLTIDLSNNLDYGEELNIDFKGDGQEQQRLGLKAKLPYLFEAPFGISAELQLFRKDSSFTTTQKALQIDYQQKSNVSWSIGHKTIESNSGLQNTVNIPDFENFKTRLWLAGLQIYEKQDVALFPHKYSLGIQGAFGQRTINLIEKNQMRFHLEGMYTFALSKHHLLYVKNTTDYISGNDIKTNEAYRFGGIQSLRGFNENTIEASAMTLINIEYRLAFNDQFYLHHISDVAFFRPPNSTSNHWLLGLGFGMASLTKAGLFKLQIAQGFDQNNRFDISQSKVHIAFATRF